MIVVTGGAGFIGSNLVRELNRRGEREVLVVDNLAPAGKFANLVGLSIADYMDKAEFRQAMADGTFADGMYAGTKVRAVLHLGACSNTLEDDGRYMMENNFTYSKEVVEFGVKLGVPVVYASTAAVYGASTDFRPIERNERPLNVYGYSKLALDEFVRRMFRTGRVTSTVVGLRYFNVYGPGEQHKGRMASVMQHFMRQLEETGTIRMFVGSGGYGNGEQRRDFVFVRDVCRVTLFFAGLLDEKPRAGVQAIVNVGTGKARTFNDVARALMQVRGRGQVEYVDFPGDLAGRYQHFTEADITGLRECGYAGEFTSLEDGVAETFAQK